MLKSLKKVEPAKQEIAQGEQKYKSFVFDPNELICVYGEPLQLFVETDGENVPLKLRPIKSVITYLVEPSQKEGKILHGKAMYVYGENEGEIANLTLKSSSFSTFKNDLNCWSMKIDGEKEFLMIEKMIKDSNGGYHFKDLSFINSGAFDKMWGNVKYDELNYDAIKRCVEYHNEHIKEVEAQVIERQKQEQERANEIKNLF